ncbi:MAG: hypothetical protein FWC87_01520 [Acidimicrobiaceae bacterium]|nr:hypothetical protein [Acidimicrobiaceae bacterium]
MIDERRAVWALVAEVVDALEPELDLWVATVEDSVLRRRQAASGGLSPALGEAVRRAVSAAVRDALARLRFQTELPQELLPELVELARLCAESRSELPQLTDPWLVGQEAFWERFEVVAERTLSDSALCWEVVKTARQGLKGHAARLNSLFLEACEREFARVAGINDDSRLRAVQRALEGHWVDPLDLGYDLASHHIALVADSSGLLDAAARLTERPLLRVESPDGGAWGWLGGKNRIADDELDSLVASLRSSDARVAVGEPAEGIAGFVASHHQAIEARAIAAATDERAVRFADLRVLIAVLRDGELAKGFIERELGELDRQNERMWELRETLRAYLEHSQSVSATAALRRRDRKTIERQLRSAEQLMHHRVSDRSDEVLLALRVAEILRSRD